MMKINANLPLYRILLESGSTVQHPLFVILLFEVALSVTDRAKISKVVCENLKRVPNSLGLEQLRCLHSAPFC
jgi:hypothetical protein